MLDSIIVDISLSSQLIFGAIGTVAYSAFTNTELKIRLGEDLNLVHTQSRSNGFLIFAVINFIGLIVLCVYELLNVYKINPNFPSFLSFLIFFLAIWWILIMGLIDIYMRNRLSEEIES